MLLNPSPNSFRWWYTNQSAPATSPGTSVTPGASNAEGSATVLATGSNLANDVYGVLLIIQGGNTSAQSKNHLLDLGWDPAGGTSYTWVVNNLTCGGSGPGDRPYVVFLPLKIPAGSRVACRIQGNNATAGTVTVVAHFFGRPTNPETVWAGDYSETIGTITNSRGPLVTPGSSAGEGSWTSLGTTSQRLRHWTVGVQLDDSTTNTQCVYVDLAWGNGTNFEIIMENVPLWLPGTAEIQSMGIPWPNSYCDVPAGATIYCRLSTTLATPDSNYAVTAVGIG
jgi:hypothetical protein